MLALIQSQSLSGGIFVTLAAGGALALTALAIVERYAAEPIFPAALWRSRVIALGNLGGFANGAVIMAIGAYLPIYIQGTMGGSVLSAGLALAANSVSWAFASVAAGRLIVRTSYRAAAVIGSLALGAGCLLLVGLEPERGLGWAIAASFVIGIGMGFCNTAFIVSIQASVGWNQRGVATSSYMFMRIVGQSVGAAVFGAVLNFGMHQYAPQSGNLVNRLLDRGLRHSLDPAELARLSDAIASSLHLVYVIAGLAALVTLALSLAMPAALGPTRPSAAPRAALRAGDETI
jgi:MFS family permease